MLAENYINEFTIDCTGDVCAGDIIMFEKDIFTGHYKRAKYSHKRTIIGEVLRDSYGTKKQQHTFILRIIWDSDKAYFKDQELRVKGRVLYRNGVVRRKWYDETNRIAVLEDKHLRGNDARELRRVLKEAKL